VTSSRAKVNDIFGAFCLYGNIGDGQRRRVDRRQEFIVPAL
jgi:hypothetical protein